MRKDLYSIIAYDAGRKYFAEWSPRELHQAYRYLTHENCPTSRFSFHTGTISIDDICDTLWNEMSYNPERFGTTSPFEFQGKNSIKKFCEKHSTCDPNVLKEVIFSRIAQKLKEFLRLMEIKDEQFETTGISSFKSLDIHLQEYYQKPDIEYVILSILVHCIREITNVNQQDYKEQVKLAKKNGKPNQIDQIILERHPSLVRPIKIENYARADRINRAQKASGYLQALSKQILSKRSEVEDTRMCIDDYQEYEGTDITSKENLLAKQEQELEDLQTQYDAVASKIKALKGQNSENIR